MEDNYIRESTVINILNGNIDKIEESDLATLKSKLKEVEKKVKEKNKPKTMTISGKDHAIIKQYCTMFNLNIGNWVSKILLKEINENNAITIDNESTPEELHEMKRKEVIDRYLKRNADQMGKCLFKSNKIVFNPNFKFVGYSMVDSLPIYEINNKNNNLDYISNNSIELKPSNIGEVSLNIFYNDDVDIII